MNLQLFALRDKALAMADGGGGKKTVVEKKEEKKPTTNKVGGVDPNSIVDYLKMNGEDSSYSARAVLADELGIANYKGSGTQNTQLLDMLKNGTAPATNAPKVTDKPKAEPKTEPKAETNPVVDNTGAPAVTAPATINGVDENIMQALNTPWSVPPAVQEAWSVTQSQLDSLLSGRTSYTDQIRDMMNKIQNREKFSYDVNTDMLFQQALASSMASGQQAMQDTMGQASALTGGYASTYAQSAGNQAYNAYIQDAYNNLPEYYQMALEAYNMEGQDMYNQLGMLSDADATEYGRMYDAYNASASNYQTMYNEAYGAYQDNWKNNYNMADMQNSDYWSGVDNTYRYDSLNQDQSQFETSTYWDNYWSEKDDTYRYDVITSNEEQARLDRRQDGLESALDRSFKSTEAEKDRQHDYNMRYDLNGDGVVNEADKALEEADEVEGYDKLTDSEIESLKQIYIDNGGGDAGDEAVARKLSLLGKSNVDAEALFDELSQLDQWTISDDTFNWWGGKDNDKYSKLGGTKTGTLWDAVVEIQNDPTLTPEEKATLIEELEKQNKK